MVPLLWKQSSLRTDGTRHTGGRSSWSSLGLDRRSFSDPVEAPANIICCTIRFQPSLLCLHLVQLFSFFAGIADMPPTSPHIEVPRGFEFSVNSLGQSRGRKQQCVQYVRVRATQSTAMLCARPVRLAALSLTGGMWMFAVA